MKQLAPYEQSLKEKMRLLAISNWSDEFNSIQLEKLADYIKAYTAPTDLVILKEGETSHFFCLICEGTVDVVKEDFGGTAKKIMTLGPGKIAGEISFFDKGTCSASLIAKDPVALLLLNRENFDKLSTDYPNIALIIVLNLMNGLSKRLRQTTGKLIDLL